MNAQRVCRIAHRFVCVQVPRKGVLGPDRLADAGGADRPVINAARDPVIVGARLTEVLLKEGQRVCPQIEARLDPEPIHFYSRRRSNAMELSNQQCLDKGRFHFRRDDKQAVGLVVNGGKLR